MRMAWQLSRVAHRLRLVAFTVLVANWQVLDAGERLEITPDAYDRWKSIETPVLSPDGRWVTYTIAGPVGEALLVVEETWGAKRFSFSTGVRTRINSRDEYFARATTNRNHPQFTEDSQFLIFTVEGRGRNEHNSATLGILRLASGKLTTVPNVLSLKLPQKASRYLAYLVATEGSVSRTLVLHDLMSGRQVRVPNVSNYVFHPHAQYLVYAVSDQTSTEAGLYIHKIGDGHVRQLMRGVRDYRSITFDHRGQQLAFLADRTGDEESSTVHGLYYVPSLTAAVEWVVGEARSNNDLRIAPHVGVKFTRTNNALVYGLEPKSGDFLEGDKLDEAELSAADFDLWHWKDPKIQPTQRLLAENAPAPSYLAVYHVGTKRSVQLGDESIAEVQLTDDALYAVGMSYKPYEVRKTWGELLFDVYLFDSVSGERQLLRRRFSGTDWSPWRFSPAGRFLLYFENRRWFSYELATGKLTDLTGALLPDVPFDAEPHYQEPRPAFPSGDGGWTEGDHRVLLYDRYDVWEIDPTGIAAPVNLTGGVGRRRNMVFRVWPHDWHQNGGNVPHSHPHKVHESSEPILLTAFDKNTISTGFWHTQISRRSVPVPLLMRDRQLKLIAQSAHPRQYLLTQESFTEFPDLWVGPRFTQLRRLTNINNHQSKYRWGTAELIEFTSTFGVPLKGILYRPDGFNASKRYPMIVGIYNHQHSGFHRYQSPAAESSGSISSAAKYLSRGYVVFLPDILNVTPYPMESALAAVIPAVQSVVDRGFIDPSRIGLLGHSHGGWEVAYIVTRTNLFRCAIMGAGITNTLSDYSSIQSGMGVASGVATSYEYERGATQHGGSIWERPWVYLANSPLMFADRVGTPLLMLHNENDQAVNFTQAIEFYISLRRNSKEAYLLNYHNESHVLHKYANRLDWDRRMLSFLDHFLRDARKPGWMEHGISFQERHRGNSVSRGNGIRENEAKGN